MQRVPTLMALVMVASFSLNLTADAADAKFYRWKDKAGGVHYTDTPPPEGAGEDVKSRREGAPIGDEKTERLRMSMIDEALTASGVKSEVQQMPAGVKAGFELGSGPAGKTPEGAAVLKVLLEAFRPERFYPALRKSFRPYLDDEQLKGALTFYRSAVGKKIVRLVGEAAPKTPDEMRAFMTQVTTNPGLQARLPLVQRLEEATGAAELGLDASVAMFKIASQAVAEIAPPDRRPAEAQIEAMAFELRRRGGEGMRQAAVLRTLYVVRTVSDDDLQQYVQFVETDAGRWYSSALRASLIDTITAVVDAVRPQLSRTLAPRAVTAPPASR